MARYGWLVGLVMTGCTFETGGLGIYLTNPFTDSDTSGPDVTTTLVMTSEPTTSTTLPTSTTEGETTMGVSATETSTGSMTLDMTTTDMTTTDMTTTDVSTTDVSTTDVSTTDVSTTDVSTTDVSTTDVSTTDATTSSTTDASTSSTSGVSSTGGDSTTGNVEPACDDQIKNGDETDVDCGGPVCFACEAGQACEVANDCVSSVCLQLQCEPPTCSDMVLNGKESDVDCGGQDCQGCVVGRSCFVNSDCVSNFCVMNVCTDHCNDNEQNADETGIDCGGSCGPCRTPVINEVDYFQPGIDDAEFVELLNTTTKPIALAGLHLHMVDGPTQLSLGFVDLSVAGILLPGQYLVVRAPGLTVAAEALTIDFPNQADNLLDGHAGLAIVDTVHATVGDALCYGGAIDAVDFGFGPVSLVEGTPTPEVDVDVAAASLVRLPNGSDTDNAIVDWQLSSLPTPGAENQL